MDGKLDEFIKKRCGLQDAGNAAMEVDQCIFVKAAALVIWEEARSISM